jgi:ribosomal-protein-alanine N-acetyltransferase
MEIQNANLLDLGALRRLERKCFEKDAWPILDIFAILTWPDVIRLKAVENDEMIGFIGGDPRPAQSVAWIATIAVDPRYQRRGIGRMLLHACEERIKLPHLRLSVRASNYNAISLYEKEGYQMVDVWKRYYSDEEDALVMEKNLDIRDREN